ncbi:MAG: pentapeptide repeat-containing protein [Synechococcales bacterium]|nr:pentapeptide repeat-containing protein [Synechococcales bacterium]
MEPDTVEALLDCLERYLKGQDGKDLPNGQRSVLYACLSEPSLTYPRMADWLRTHGFGSYKPQTLKNDAYLVFKRLGKALNDEIKKKNCHRRLQNWYESWRSQTAPSPLPPAPSSTLQSPRSLIRFKCWEQDLLALTAAIQSGRRIVCIQGAACAGKTSLAYALVEHIRSDFEAVISCQAADVPTVESLYRKVSSQLHQEIWADSAISALSEILQTHRVLVVIDQTEVLLQPRKLAGQFQEVCADYETWLKRLLEAPAHAGCLLWVGQEPPACFAPQYYSVLFIHPVSRLEPEDAATLLKARNVPIDAIARWEDLVAFCGGNPAWLPMEMERLQRSPAQDVASFLANPSLDPHLVTTLERELERLTDAEHRLLFWLLLQPVVYGEIRHLDIPGILPSDLEYALTSLERRSLVRRDANQCYRLDPPLLEYVLAEQVIRGMEAELTSRTLKRLCQYRLFHGSATVQRQRWQHQHLLENLAERCRNRHSFRQEQRDAIQALLDQVRRSPLPQQDIAISNLTNLAVTLNLTFAKLNLRGLPLRHVDLRRADLRDANLEGCVFQEARLPLRLSAPLTTDLAAGGGAIAIGDQNGHLLYWQRQGGTLRLQAFRQAAAPIDQIRFQDKRTLIFVSNQRVYSWWLDSSADPEMLVELPNRASCLACNGSSHIAIGLVDGQIILWNEIIRQARTLDNHRNEVCNLTFSPDGRSLASVGMGNRVLLWCLSPDNGSSLPYDELSSGSRICLATAWNQQGLLRAEIQNAQICLRNQTTLLQEIVLSEGMIVDLCFSKNGHNIVGSTDSGFIFCWAWQRQSLRSLKQADMRSITVKSFAEDRWLLLLTANQVQLYDAQKQEIFWEIDGSIFDYANCNLQGTHGLTTAEKELMRSLGATISDAKK